ncbi:portal protein [Moorella phage MTATph1]
MLAKLAKAIKIVTLSFSQGRNSFETSPVDFNEIMRAYNSDGYVRQALDKYINLLFKAGWGLVGKNDKAVEYLKARFRLMAMATGVPTEQFFIGIAEDLVKYHNVFLVRSRIKGPLTFGKYRANPVSKKGVVGGYFRMHPSTVTIERDLDGTILSYRQTTSSQRKDFAPDDVIHFYLNKEAGMAFGYPFIAPGIEDVRLLRQLEEHASLLVYRHLFPIIHYQVGRPEPGREATDEEIQDVQDEVENMPTEAAIIVTSERHNMKPVNVNPINAKPYLEHFENRVFSDLGISQVAMGRGDTANRSTAESMTLEMHDHIKAIQKIMAGFIDLYIIHELLLEGGFDPISNPDDDVDFVFNEIDTDYLIKTQNHEVYKFEHNIQTWEETRRNLGLDTAIDESRLYFNMVQIPLAQAKAEATLQAGTPDTNNREQPTNQHGTRAGPKLKNSEAFGLQMELDIPRLIRQLVSLYDTAQEDVIAIIKRDGPQKSYMPLDMAFNKVRQILNHSCELSWASGMARGRRDHHRTGAIADVDIIRAVLADRRERYLQGLLRDLESMLGNISGEDFIAQAAGVFAANRYRLQAIAAYEVPLAFNCAYALVARDSGITTLPVKVTDTCDTCNANTEVRLDGDLTDLPSVVPPWHPYCGCFLTFKGGEW